eukprot:8129362-Pyramimonas_sp.AAC.1
MATTPFVELSQGQLFIEMETLLSHLELDRTIFRSDHASNYLVLKGVLPRDKAKLLQQVRTAIRDAGAAQLRPESWTIRTCVVICAARQHELPLPPSAACPIACTRRKPLIDNAPH